MKFFIHLCLWLLKQQTRKRKRKCILCHFWNTPFGVFFGALSQKLEVLLSIFCGTKITLKWITFLPTPFLDLPPPIMPYPPINM